MQISNIEIHRFHYVHRFLVDIIEFERQTFGPNAPNQIVHTKTVYLSSGCASTALWPIKFISPVIILPHRVYEYRMTHNGGYTGVYRSGAMKSELKLDEGVIIQIHKNPTNGERSGLIRAMSFNRI